MTVTSAAQRRPSPSGAEIEAILRMPTRSTSVMLSDSSTKLGAGGPPMRGRYVSSPFVSAIGLALVLGCGGNKDGTGTGGSVAGQGGSGLSTGGGSGSSSARTRSLSFSART